MRKILLPLAACALLLLPSCRFVGISDEVKQRYREYGESIFNDDDDDTEESIVASSTITTHDEVTGEFHKLRCNLPCDVTYTPGDCALSFRGPDNVLDHIIVKNENGTLSIQSDGVSFRKLAHLKVKLSSPVIESLTFNGAVDFSAPEGITALDFSATINGAGDVEISSLKSGKARIEVNGAGDADIRDIDCDELVVSINGAGDGKLAGSARHASLSISGAGNIDATRLKTRSIDSKVRGIGKISKPKD